MNKNTQETTAAVLWPFLAVCVHSGSVDASSRHTWPPLPVVLAVIVTASPLPEKPAAHRKAPAHRSPLPPGHLH